MSISISMYSVCCIAAVVCFYTVISYIINTHGSVLSCCAMVPSNCAFLCGNILLSCDVSDVCVHHHCQRIASVGRSIAS